jgi:hypothetical protein
VCRPCSADSCRVRCLYHPIYLMTACEVFYPYQTNSSQHTSDLRIVTDQFRTRSVRARDAARIKRPSESSIPHCASTKLPRDR